MKSVMSFSSLLKELMKENIYLKFLTLKEKIVLLKKEDFSVKMLSLAIKEVKKREDGTNIKKIAEIKGDEIEIPENMFY